MVLDGDPSSLINLVLNGAEPIVVKGTPDAYRMPQFRVQLTDEEIAEVLSFVRGGWGNGATPVTTGSGEGAAPGHRPQQRPDHHPEDALRQRLEAAKPGVSSRARRERPGKIYR